MEKWRSMKIWLAVNSPVQEVHVEEPGLVWERSWQQVSSCRAQRQLTIAPSWKGCWLGHQSFSKMFCFLFSGLSIVPEPNCCCCSPSVPPNNSWANLKTRSDSGFSSISLVSHYRWVLLFPLDLVFGAAIAPSRRTNTALCEHSNS